jgi:hypothetical protein
MDVKRKEGQSTAVESRFEKRRRTNGRFSQSQSAPVTADPDSGSPHNVIKTWEKSLPASLLAV